MTGSDENRRDTDPVAEADRLHRQNAELNEQIKLLVQTEQELYRSRTALDRDLDRINALGRFALASSSELDTPEAVAQHAASLLSELFDLDHARALHVEVAVGTVLGTDRSFALAPEAVERIETMPTVLSPFVDDAVREWLAPLAEVIEALLPELPPDPRGAALVLVPLRPGEELYGLIAACRPKSARRSFHREALGDAHLPFLHLLESHLSGALQNANLKKYLTEQSARLAETNRRLTTSLDHLERTQDQLVQAQKMEAVGRLAGGIAHDFNNLLTVITSHAELLRAEVDSKGSRRLDHIRDAGDRAARIISQLLAFSRRQRATPESLDVSSLAADMGDLLGRLIGEHVQLELDLGDAPHRVWADRTQVEQILLNLVVNARDAMPQGGVVLVTVRTATKELLGKAKPRNADREYVAVEVADTGHGMDEATLAQVFEPFFTTKETGRGTGLGLSTVYGLVQMNDGEILAQSKPGEGSRFTVLLPAAEASAIIEEAFVVAQEETKSGTSTVLLAEDEEGIRDLAAHILELNGYHVLVARDGMDALARARSVSGSIHLLLTDVVMPRLGGPGLARQLVSDRPGLRVLLMTGYSPDEISGADGWSMLAKPFTPAELLEAVRRCLSASSV